MPEKDGQGSPGMVESKTHFLASLGLPGGGRKRHKHIEQENNKKGFT